MRLEELQNWLLKQVPEDDRPGRKRQTGDLEGAVYRLALLLERRLDRELCNISRSELDEQLVVVGASERPWPKRAKRTRAQRTAELIFRTSRSRFYF